MGGRPLSNANGANLRAPPGFLCLTAFSLKRTRENGDSKDDAMPKTSNSASLGTCLGKRPWILYEPANYELEESDLEQPKNKKICSGTCIPKGVFHGCPDCSNCLKVTAKWRPEEARKDIIEDAPIFYPTEEEFKDTLKYIAKIRPRAESYGVCRISPPPSWNPPRAFKEDKFWVKSKFITQAQRIDGLQVPHSKLKSSFVQDNNGKRRTSTGLRFGSDSLGAENSEESVCGPEFTLGSFKKYSDNFKAQYFRDNEAISSNNCSTSFHGKSGPSIENIEGEYNRIVDAPTEEIEVLSYDDSTNGVFGSGFPCVSNSSHSEIENSSWNLNDVAKLSKSLLSFERCVNSRVLAQRVRIGTCFSTLNWRAEEHHLYSLSFLHLGAPKIWYAVPRRGTLKFELALQNSSQDTKEKRNRLEKHLLPSALKSEGIPVFRCVQSMREYVVVFPGVHHSSFDSGFSISESTNFAPVDWLPHGGNAVEFYRDSGRKTSLSHDRLLLQAAYESVRAQWDFSLRKKISSRNQFWTSACGKEGILTKAFKLRVKSEEMARKFLCSSSRTRKMDERFDAVIKRECKICLYDLHFSAAGCPCSSDTYSCLIHAKKLCRSCAWDDIFFLFRHETDELNRLIKALEGEFSSIMKWAKVLKLSLYSASGRSPSLTPLEDNSERSSSKPLLHDSDSVSNRKAEIKALVKSMLAKKSELRNLTERYGVERNPNSTSRIKIEGKEASESANVSNKLESSKEMRAASASGSSIKIESSFPQMDVALGVPLISLSESSDEDESDDE